VLEEEELVEVVEVAEEIGAADVLAVWVEDVLVVWFFPNRPEL
jgi:hypothetical protein